MKRINKIVLSVAFFAGAASLGSCESFIDIDKYIYEKITLDSVWVSKERTQAYINGTVGFLRNESRQYGETSFPFVVADEAILPWMRSWDVNQSAFMLIGDLSPRQTRRIEWWPEQYKGIRKANLILANLHKNMELTDAERRDFMGQVHFLRAYFYYNLIRLWGPVPLLPETAFDTDTPNDELAYERSSWDDCVEHICADMEKAAEYLPATRPQTTQYLPTRGAALSVIARLRLHSASPLYNGNTYYSNWKRTDGTHFISQTVDNSKWGQAAAAFKRVIDLDRYQLYTTPILEGDDGTLPLPVTVSDAAFPLGAGDIDPYLSYKQIFDGSIIPDHNPELIYYYPMDIGNDYNQVFSTDQGGWNGFSTTWEMASAYRMADGQQFEEWLATAEDPWRAVGGSQSTFSKNYVLHPLRSRMDDNREPRFYASIGFMGCVWPATSYTGTVASVMNLVANYSHEDGNFKAGDGESAEDRNATGYGQRKWTHQEDMGDEGEGRRGGRTAKTYPVIRYAEILLGYVEAMNEMNESYTDEATGITVSRDPAEMVYYFNQIRYRAGLPGITEADVADQIAMRAMLKQERRVEFAFEGHRYFDLRRWKDSYAAINTPLLGMSLNLPLGTNDAQRQAFFTLRVWNTEAFMRRQFNNNMYFYPIPQSVMDKNGKLVQNPGW